MDGVRPRRRPLPYTPCVAPWPMSCRVVFNSCQASEASRSRVKLALDDLRVVAQKIAEMRLHGALSGKDESAIRACETTLVLASASMAIDALDCAREIQELFPAHITPAMFNEATFDEADLRRIAKDYEVICEAARRQKNIRENGRKRGPGRPRKID